MARLTNAQLVQWAQFYARLAATDAWNAFTMWAKVTATAVAVQGAGLVDLRSIGLKGAGWTLLGTIVARIAASLFENPLPEPTKPESPTT